MSEDSGSSEDKTEEATPERRDDFRDRGQVVMSKDVTSVFVLAACVVTFTSGAPLFLKQLERLLIRSFENLATTQIDNVTIMAFATEMWIDVLKLIIPMFLVAAVTSTALTLLQTRMNWSWERMSPDFSRLEPFSGLMRMFNMDALIELVKSIAKMAAVGAVTYVILHNEWSKVPELMSYPMASTWKYWGGITRKLFWSVSAFLLVFAAIDYVWNFFSLEKEMKMSKQDVKEDYKKREVDQHVKAKMRRMQRDMATKKTLAKTRTATVMITNPTHYSIALRYDKGDRAPVLVAKGTDFLALTMRQIAKEENIPIIENRPVARELYATVKEGDEIPDKFYKIVAEIIRYVFRIKGRPIPKKRGLDARS